MRILVPWSTTLQNSQRLNVTSRSLPYHESSLHLFQYSILDAVQEKKEKKKKSQKRPKKATPWRLEMSLSIHDRTVAVPLLLLLSLFSTQLVRSEQDGISGWN